jgi:DNA-binding transcriptional LysR family regulator
MPLSNVMARMISGSEFLELRAFLAVAEHLSFRAAAASLGNSPSAISQQVSGLEARLGLRLLQRTTRSVSLTDDGAAFYQQAAPELANLSRALTSAQSRSHDVQGLVRLHAFRTASEMFLDQALPDFLTAFPSVQVDLTVNDAPIGLPRTAGWQHYGDQSALARARWKAPGHSDGGGAWRAADGGAGRL